MKDDHLDARVERLRLLCAVTWPAPYQSLPADIEALLREYDRLREAAAVAVGR